MNDRFIDTNVLLRHLAQDHPDHSYRATRLIEEIARGNIRGHISETVIFEVIFTMTKTYSMPRQTTHNLMVQLLSLHHLILPTKLDILEALNYWREQSPLSFADCYHLVRTKSLGLTEIYSFDKKMGRYPGVSRIEP